MESGRKIALHAPDSANIGGETGAANFLKQIINTLTLLKHIGEARKRTRIYANYCIAHQMVGNTRQLHDYDAHVLRSFWQLTSDKFLHRHVPTHIVDG